MNTVKQIETGRRFDEKASLLINDMLEKCMRTEEGRFMLIHLAEAAGYREKTFTGNSRTFYNEGKRSVGIGIIESMRKISFSLYQQAEAEYEAKLEEVKRYAEGEK